MVFILYKLYVLLPYTYPTPKLSPHRRRCIYIFPQKTKIFHSVWFISVLNYGDTENVLINHLLLVIPMSYPCHYTNLCPHKPHKHAPPHTHTHTKKSIVARPWCSNVKSFMVILKYKTKTTMWYYIFSMPSIFYGSTWFFFVLFLFWGMLIFEKSQKMCSNWLIQSQLQQICGFHLLSIFSLFF